MSEYGDLDAAQKVTVEWIMYYGKKLGADEVEVLSAIYIAGKEDNFYNEDRGSGTSVGWRQDISEKGTLAERLSYAYTVPQYFAEAKEKRSETDSFSELGYLVQRPEVDYTDIPAGEAQARAIYAGVTGKTATAPAGSPAGVTGSTSVPVTPAVVQTADPKDSSPKVTATGRKLSESGSHFEGHSKAMRSLLTRGL